MKFCPYCGTRLQDDVKFCGECGQKQPDAAAPAPQSANTYDVPVQPEPFDEQTMVLEQTDVPVYQVPVQEEPVYEAPAYEEPVYEAPAYEEPAYEAPAYEAPAYEVPAQEKPVYEAPAYEAPVYEAPVYEAPVYEAPAYEAPQQNYAPPYGAPVYDPVGYGAAVPQKPKKKKTGLIIGIAVAAVAVIALILVLFLGGSGGAETVHYEAYSCQLYGMELGVDDEWIELEPDGKATLRLVDEEYEGTWKLDGDRLTIKMDGDRYVGTLEDGEIEMEFWGMTYRFSEDESKASSWNNDDDVVINDTVGGEWIEPQPEETLPVKDTISPAEIFDLDGFEGDWYGWWVVSTVIEGDPEMEGTWWDACANLETDGDGYAYLTVWDEDNSREDPMGEATMKVYVQDGELWFESEDGYFMAEALEYGEWSGHTNEMDYPDVMCFIGEYDDGDVVVEYLFFLRPWGTVWSDAEEANPDDLPYYYYDWYLPLIESGVGEAPSTIG